MSVRTDTNVRNRSKRNNLYGWRSAYIQFFLFQLIHICGFYFLEPDKPDAWLLLISGILNVLIYTRLLLADIRYGDDDINPFWFYLGMSILRIGVGVIYVAAIIWTGDLWAIRLGRIDASTWLMGGHLLLLVGDYCLIAGYFFGRNLFHRKRQQLFSPRSYSAANVYKAGLIMVGCGFGLRILESFVSLGGLGQIVSYVSNYGVPAGIFMMLDSCRKKSPVNKTKIIIVISLLMFALFSGFSSYMKTDLLIGLFPAIFIVIDLGLYRFYRSGRRNKIHFRVILLAGFIAYFFLFTVSAYSGLRRAGYWENMATSEVIPTQSAAPDVLPDLIKSLMASVPGTNEFDELQQYPDEGVWNMINRLSVTSWAATSVKLVEMSGMRQDSMLGAILLSITPRILYPDKPQITWGREVAVELGQARSIETATTATSLTMSGFLYWWGGYANVIIMTFLSGVTFAFVYLLFAKDWRINPISALVIMAMTFNGFHWKESDVLAGFPFYLYMLIVFAPLSKLLRENHLGRKRVRNLSMRNEPVTDWKR